MTWGMRVRSVAVLGAGFLVVTGCPQDRADTRAVISGRVVLAAVPGADDMSRVRVELGRGEGGIMPDADGNFAISDLEPDTYEVAVSYIGGLEDASAGSAYAPWSARVVTRAGGSAALGVVELPLGTGSVRGQFARSDSGPMGGMTVKLLGGAAPLEAVSPDGSFQFTTVPVGRYQLMAQRDGVAGDCGRALVVGAHAQEVVVPAATLEPATFAFSPALDNGVSQAFATDGNRWFLRFDHVTVMIAAPGARRMRNWTGTDGGGGAFVDAAASVDLTGVVANAETDVHFQFQDACGQESPVETLHLVRDTAPPIASALLNSGSQYASDATMLLEVTAYDALSMPLTLQRSVCNDEVCVPASVADAPREPVLPVTEVTFTDVDGPKRVKLRITDGSENSVDLESTVTLQSRLDRTPPENVVITVLDGDGMVGTATRLRSPVVRMQITATGVDPDGTRSAEIRLDLGTTFANAVWAPFVSGGVYSRDTGLDAGAASVWVQLRDTAGNVTTPFQVPVVIDNTADITGTVLLEGRSAYGGTMVSVLGTAHQSTTDDTGAFVIPSVPAGTYVVEVRAAGFRVLRYPGTDVVPPLVTDLGIAELAPARGRIAGSIRLEGRTGHAGVSVVLPLEGGGEVRTVTDGAGAFSMAMTPGTYNGDLVASFPPNFRDATFTTPIIVQEDQVFNTGELLAVAIANDLSGTVTVEDGAVEQTAITIFGEPGTPTEGVAPPAVYADSSGSWSVTGLPLGLYRVHVRNPSVQGLEEAWRAGVLIDKGPATLLGAVNLRKRFVVISNGDALTRSATVDLALANSTDCLEVEISNAAGFSPSTRESCRAVHTGWSLGTGQGLKTVYVRYYTAGSPTIPSAVVTDDITVDSVATITAFTYSPTSSLRVGTLVTFLLTAGEPGGTATASIGSYAQGLVLRDDGLSGDGAADDGVYGLRYTLDLPTDVVNARVDGNFRDAAGNAAAVRTATPNMNVAVPPLITNIRVGVDTQARVINIAWDTDENTTGSVRYGTDTTYGLGTVTTVGSAARSWSVNLNAAALTPGAVYHFNITAVDTAANQTVTNDRTFYFRPSTPLFVAAIPGDGKAWVRWEGPDQRDIQGFHVYRALTETGPFTRLTPAPYTHEVNLYEDATVTNDTEYFYQVTTVDGSGNESAPSYAHAATPGGNAGPTPVAGVLRGINVWSSRGSPYLVSGDLQVETNATPDEAPALLVVGPGTEVHFRRAEGSTLTVSGRIAVLGARGPMVPDGSGGQRESDEGMVIFKSAETAPARGDWGGVNILAVSAPGTLDLTRDAGTYQSGSVFFRADMRHAGSTLIAAEKSANALVPSALYVARSRLADCTNGAVRTTTREAVLRDTEVFNLGNANVSGIEFYSSSLVLVERLHMHDIGGLALMGGLTTVSSSPRWRDAYGLVRDSTIERAGRGGVRLDAFMRGVDLTVRQVTGDTQAVSGSGSVTRSLVENSDMGSRVADVAYSTFRGNRQAITDGNAWGNEIVDSGCPVGTACANVRDVFVSDNTVQGNVVGETVPHERETVLYLSNYSATGIALHNHVLVPPSPNHPLVKVSRLSTRFEFNSLLSAPDTALTLVECTAAYAVDASGNPRTVNMQNNFWGATVNAAIDANPRDPQTFIRDYWDSPSTLAEVDYSPATPDPYPIGRISAPWWGQRFYEGETVTFTATGSDPVEGVLDPSTFAWVTDSGTPLGTGGTITVSTFAADHPTGTPPPPPRRKVYRVLVVIPDAAAHEVRMPVEFEVWPAP